MWPRPARKGVREGHCPSHSRLLRQFLRYFLAKQRIPCQINFGDLRVQLMRCLRKAGPDVDIEPHSSLKSTKRLAKLWKCNRGGIIRSNVSTSRSVSIAK